uniref:GRAM domain containing 2A n=1 Tax=Sus scrofa TaxID=9823 RepID=A0A8D0N1N2_PIG
MGKEPTREGGRLRYPPMWDELLCGASTWFTASCGPKQEAKGLCPWGQVLREACLSPSQVVIPVVSVQMIKKHKMARLLPNGLAITTNTSQKYVFVSLLSRDSVYDMLRRVCTHLQPSSKKSLSVREFPEEPECESLEVLIPEMKWRKVCPASRSLSLPDNIPCIPRASVDSADGLFPSRKPPGSENAVCEDKLEEEARSDRELRLWDYRLLKIFFVLICFLVMSSSYLAFRISQLEQQLCSLTWDGSVPGHR